MPYPWKRNLDGPSRRQRLEWAANLEEIIRAHLDRMPNKTFEDRMNRAYFVVTLRAAAKEGLTILPPAELTHDPDTPDPDRLSSPLLDCQ